MTLLEWVAKWGIPPQALKELAESCVFLDPNPDEDKTPEGSVQRDIRLAAARKGIYTFRNNRGAFQNEYGAWVRYGLANDSKKLGDSVKSGDLIGLETIFVTVEMVLEAIHAGLPGFKVGRFLSVEAKRKNWTFRATLEDLAQLKWATFVNDAGGRALITNRPEDL